jgi:hypothetical protein
MNASGFAGGLLLASDSVALRSLSWQDFLVGGGPLGPAGGGTSGWSSQAAVYGQYGENMTPFITQTKLSNAQVFR